MKRFIKISILLMWLWILFILVLMLTFKKNYIAYILSIIITFICIRIVKIFEKLFNEDLEHETNAKK